MNRSKYTKNSIEVTVFYVDEAVQFARLYFILNLNLMSKCTLIILKEVIWPDVRKKLIHF